MCDASRRISRFLVLFTLITQGACAAPPEVPDLAPAATGGRRTGTAAPPASCADLQVLPASQSYLTPTLATTGALTYCNLVFNSGPDGSTNLGPAFMSSQVVILDREHNQTGFAPQKGCPSF